MSSTPTAVSSNLQKLVGKEIANEFSSTYRARMTRVEGDTAHWVSVPRAHDPGCIVGGRAGESFTTSTKYAFSIFYS